ncbi:hypothetical protein [Alicyclobacillus acidiphilus]|uniref:hypothetical protein n=1 Tax=Alicyclobacillus acidiphilus TaxID=182455 RepID=UPI00082FD860|nr:hypothetical protein [Alicyclobacillus acidiphilus]
MNEPVKVYDTQFNQNEWTVMIGLCVGLVLIYLLPRRFSRKLSIVFFMCGVTCGFLFDHVISVMPVSFYDVNDTSQFQIMDFISYWMYGPISYLFFYVYDRFHVKPKFSPIYILCSALISTCCEWAAVKIGIFHYDHGYKLQVSFVIYLLVQSTWVRFFYLMKRADSNESLHDGAGS